MELINLQDYTLKDKSYWIGIRKVELAIELINKGWLKTAYVELNLQNLNSAKNKFFDHMLNMIDNSPSLHLGIRLKDNRLFLLISVEKAIIETFEMMKPDPQIDLSYLFTKTGGITAVKENF